MERCGILGVGPRARWRLHPARIRQSSISSTSSRSTATASLSRTTSARACDGCACHRQAAGGRTGRSRRGAAAVAGPACRRWPAARGRSAGRLWERHRFPANRGLREREVHCRTRPRRYRRAGTEVQVLAATRSGWKGRRAARGRWLCLERKRGTPLGEGRCGPNRGEGGRAQTSDQCRVDPARIRDLPSDRCGPFLSREVQSRRLRRKGTKSAIFLLRRCRLML